ncbi:MAG: tetratricopeptide repeat protein [Chrysiogenetes bacterium]|nr:tetratricopeptide repeat protein [Chrysiogenetes bacterium]
MSDQSWKQLLDEAEEAFENRDFVRAEVVCGKAMAAAEAVLDPADIGYSKILTATARAYAGQGRDEEAEPLFVQATEKAADVFGEAHHEVSRPMLAHAQFLLERKRYDESESLFRQAFALREKDFGDVHEELIRPLLGWAAILVVRNELSQAQLLIGRAYDIAEAKLPADDPRYGQVVQHYVRLLRELGRTQVAGEILERAKARGLK